MASIQDDRGYNQAFKPSNALKIRYERRSRLIMSEMNINLSGDILEIGCGQGEMSHFIAEHSKMNVLGTDLCMPFIEEANNRYSLPNLTFDILDFNYPEKLQGKKFDYIVGNGILHHLYNQIDETFANLKNLLKDGGKIIFIEPNLVNPYCFVIFGTTKYFRNLAKLEPDEKAFTKCFLRKKLKNAGYKNLKISNVDFLLPIIPDFLIKPSIVIGNVAEKTPLLKLMSQSVFICAEK